MFSYKKEKFIYSSAKNPIASRNFPFASEKNPN